MTSGGADVLVALSGGLDSAAAVLFLREEGYRPRALFLDMLDSEQGRRQAGRTAETLGVELIVEPCADRFRKEVVGHALAEHAAGRTPSPCSRCNPRIKWRLLVEAADRLGIRSVATGHYVRTVERNGHVYFRRGRDTVKDQSYYLWDVPEPLIRRAVLPLGDLTKAEVRRILAEKYGLTELVRRRESMGVCFLEGKRYGDFLKANLPAGTVRPGETVDLRGVVIGRHEGFPLYTAGQKRGFFLFEPGSGGMAVVSVDAAGNRIVAGLDEALYYRRIILKEWRATCPQELFDHAAELQVAVRGVGRNPEGGCRLTVLDDGSLEVSLLHDRAWALMPGQPTVFYLDDRVVGGGVSDEVKREA